MPQNTSVPDDELIILLAHRLQKAFPNIENETDTFEEATALIAQFLIDGGMVTQATMFGDA